jgi:glycosyltransferase involved in cell wall biosynthesis
MRIAHIITRMIIGGAQENTLLNCYDLIHDFGDEVLLLTGPEQGPEGNLLAQSAHPVPVEIVPALCREIHPYADVRAYYQIKRALQKFQPDVVHTHSAKAGILGRLAAWSLHVPAVVHTVHGAPFHAYQNFLSRGLYRWCEQMAGTRCHRFICVAHAMTDLLVTAGITSCERCTTIYSGMEVAPFVHAQDHRAAMRAQLGYNSEHVVIGKIARLSPLKGHDDLLLAAEQVLISNPHVRFLMVGDGRLRDSLQRQVQDWGLEDCFQWTGLVAPDDIPRYLSAMDILVHTSLREGLARALPQALLAGIPVVSYDIDGAREVCIPDETGYLVPPRKIADLSEALLRLSESAPLRARLGNTGQQRFQTQFDHHTMTARIRDIYKSLLHS